MKRSGRVNFSGLWEAESAENYEAFLVACGYNVFRRKLALLHLSKPTQFYKHRGDEMEFSQMQQGRVLTSYMRVGERTEVELPDGSTTFVLSSWDGNTWVTLDDAEELETRRWMDGDTLIMTETRLRQGEAAVTCKRVFRWVAADPVWSGESDDMQVLMKRTVTADEEEYLLAAQERPPPIIKEVVKTSVVTVTKGAGLMASISSSISSGWSVLETILTDKPPVGEKDWHAVFSVDRKRKLLGAFNCSLAGHALNPGRLYIFEDCVGFYATLPTVIVKVIRASDITDVLKVTVALTSSLEIRTLTSGPILFTNFLSRDQAHELISRVMWGFHEASSSERPVPVALGFSGERYLFVRINAARPSASGTALKTGMSDCFVKLSVGSYTARTFTVENSASPQFDTVCVFPCTVIDPASDLLTISLHNESMNGANKVLGDLPISLAGTKAAPSQSWTGSKWRAQSVWHKLEMDGDGAGDMLQQAEVSLAVWTASSTDPAFRTARTAVRVPPAGRLDYDSARLKTYEEPRMAYLFLDIIKASGLKARENKPNGMSDPFCHVVVGKERARTRIVQDTLNPAWNDSFTFVVEKPLSGSILLELYDGDQQEDDFIGQVVVPLQDLQLRRSGSRTVPAPRWYRVTKRRDKYDHATSRMLSGDLAPLGSLMSGNDGDDTLREHLGELELVAYLDSDYLPQEADRAPVGQLSVEVVRARQLARAGNTFAVAHYGRSWARLPTVSGASPDWRQELLFPVRDMSDVLAVGVFRQAPAGLLSAAGEEFLGKACIRPGTLLPGRQYRRSVPLLVGHKDGVLQMGVLDLSIKFVRYSATATMARYLALPLPSKCYMDPPAESTAEALPEWEEALVEAHLGAAQPPLPPSVQRAMRPMFDPRLSMRLLRVHLGRLMARFVSDRAAGPSLLDPEQWWKEPHLMVLLHIVFIFLVFNPQLLLPLLLVSVATVGFVNNRAAPLIGPDPWLSTGGQFAESMTLLRNASAPQDAAADAAPQDALADGAAPADAAAGDEWASKPLALTEHTGDDGATEALDTLLDGVLEEAGSSGPDSAPAASRQLSAERQKKLFRALAVYGRAAQQVADHYATRIEQVAGVFNWREPLVSRSVFTLMLLAALALFFIPLRSVVVAAGMFFMRHPALRAPAGPSVLPFFLSRLSSLRDHVV